MTTNKIFSTPCFPFCPVPPPHGRTRRRGGQFLISLFLLISLFPVSLLPLPLQILPLRRDELHHKILHALRKTGLHRVFVHGFLHHRDVLILGHRRPRVRCHGFFFYLPIDIRRVIEQFLTHLSPLFRGRHPHHAGAKETTEKQAFFESSHSFRFKI